jgi:hypothetical protein
MSFAAQEQAPLVVDYHTDMDNSLPPQRVNVCGWILKRRVHEWMCVVMPILLCFVLFPTDVSSEVGQLNKSFEHVASTFVYLLSLTGVNAIQLLVLSVLGSIVPLEMAGPEFQVAKRRIAAVGVACLLIGATA